MASLLPTSSVLPGATEKLCPGVQKKGGSRKPANNWAALLYIPCILIPVFKVALQRVEVLVCSPAHSHSQHCRVPRSCSPRARSLLHALTPSCTPFSFPSLYSPAGTFALHCRDASAMQPWSSSAGKEQLPLSQTVLLCWTAIFFQCPFSFFKRVPVIPALSLHLHMSAALTSCTKQKARKNGLLCPPV